MTTEAQDALAVALRRDIFEAVREVLREYTHQDFAIAEAKEACGRITDAILAALPDGWVLARKEHRWQDCTVGPDCPQPQCNGDADGNCRSCGNPFVAAAVTR